MGKEKLTIEVDADWAAKLRAQGVDVARHVESLISPPPQAFNWAEENADAINAYNREIEERGLWSDGLRLF